MDKSHQVYIFFRFVTWFTTLGAWLGLVFYLSNIEVDPDIVMALVIVGLFLLIVDFHMTLVVEAHYRFS